jgi:hypothetical protein
MDGIISPFSTLVIFTISTPFPLHILLRAFEDGNEVVKECTQFSKFKQQ